MQRRLVLILEFDEFLDAAFVMEGLTALLSLALVLEYDLNALVQECHLSEAMLEGREVKNCGLKDFRIRPKGRLGAGLFGFADNLQFGNGLALFVALSVNLAVSLDLDFHVCRKRVDDGRADTVQTAGYLVASAAEFAAGMQNRMNNFNRRNTKFRMLVHRHTSAVILYHDGVVLLNRDMDRFAISGERFVDTVVHDFIDQMMQTLGTCTADVHAGSFANRFESLKDLYLGRVILTVCFFF